MSHLGIFDASEHTLLRVLEGLRRSAPPPTVPDSVFALLDAILDPDHVPDEDVVPDLTMRMRGSLMELLPLIPEHDATKPEFESLIAVARRLLDEDPAGDYLGVRLHLRRMAVAGLGLVDLLAPLPVPCPPAETAGLVNRLPEGACGLPCAVQSPSAVGSSR
ncbi:DUF6415 family natural product biosynthesis protein [Streptomyces sp. 3211]|uniref:DUF6415 family natural product biosynthesis protein n=1 Tax=Streptomyces sp. 3211 TaxID=1964449 RepID=UPI0009A4BA12|nr:DUF6415 family natural product biosynthesis protein [Streptomyces sp. 3211]